jgi:hypothetical protein
MKIHAVFHANGRTDGQTHMTKLIVAFCNFANAPKKGRTNVALKFKFTGILDFSHRLVLLFEYGMTDKVQKPNVSKSNTSLSDYL